MAAAVDAVRKPFVGELLGRSDFAIIGEIVEPGSKVLDLGCGEGELLQHNRTLQTSIRLRNPYVDALSYFQITLLRAWRQTGRTRDDVKRAVLLSINGIANGMRNTG